MPKISVLMPVYKTPESYLREAIESILNQTYTDFEFLILDDCPDDDREDIVASYQDKRIKYIKNEKNMGISETRNKLIDMAKGEYLAIFDHDDISLPERLEKEAAYLDEHPEIGVVGANTKTIIRKRISRIPTENIEIKKKLLSRCVVIHTAAMVRKSVLLENNIRYEAKFSPAEDYMLWVRLIDKTMFHNLSDVLVYYRDFKGNTSHLQQEKMHDRDALIRCIAYSQYPYLLSNSTPSRTVYLFGFLPMLKIKHGKNKDVYLLFGIIPLLIIRKK